MLTYLLPVVLVLWIQWFVMMYVSGHSIMSETGRRGKPCCRLLWQRARWHSVEWPHMNHFYTRLVDNNHAHYYGTDNLNNIGGVVASTGLNLLFGFRKAWKALLSFIVNDGRPLVDLSKEQHLHLQQCHLPTSLKLTIMSVWFSKERHLLVMQRRRSLYNNMIQYT